MTISTTTNLGLKKPVLGTAEDADITTINDNMDTLDAAVGAVDVSTDGSLQEQINDLGESVSQIGTTSLGNGVYYSKSGNIVLVAIINAAIGELATLPTGCRPKVNISNNRGALGIVLSGYNNFGYVTVFLDGKITVSANSGSGFTGQVMFSII